MIKRRWFVWGTLFVLCGVILGDVADNVAKTFGREKNDEKPYLAGYDGTAPLLLIAESHEAFATIEEKYIAGDRENMMRDWLRFNPDEQVAVFVFAGVKRVSQEEDAINYKRHNVRLGSIYKQESIALGGKEKDVENKVRVEAVIYLLDSPAQDESVLVSPWGCEYVSRKKLKMDDCTKFELWLEERKVIVCNGARNK